MKRSLSQRANCNTGSNDYRCWDKKKLDIGSTISEDGSEMSGNETRTSITTSDRRIPLSREDSSQRDTSAASTRSRFASSVKSYLSFVSDVLFSCLGSSRTTSRSSISGLKALSFGNNEKDDLSDLNSYRSNASSTRHAARIKRRLRKPYKSTVQTEEMSWTDGVPHWPAARKEPQSRGSRFLQRASTRESLAEKRLKQDWDLYLGESGEA
jgi:hypothetical protein